MRRNISFNCAQPCEANSPKEPRRRSMLPIKPPPANGLCSSTSWVATAFQGPRDFSTSKKCFFKLTDEISKAAFLTAEAKQRALVAQATDNCNEQLKAMEAKTHVIALDLETIIEHGCRHCQHHACVQQQANLGWKKLERAYQIVDRYRQLILQFVGDQFTEVWQSTQASISYADPQMKLEARQTLSASFHSSCENVFQDVKMRVKACYSILRKLEKSLTAKQKRLDGSHVTAAEAQCTHVCGENDWTARSNTRPLYPLYQARMIELQPAALCRAVLASSSARSSVSQP